MTGDIKTHKLVDCVRILGYKQNMKIVPTITAQELRDAFDYNPDMGDLCWKIRPANNVKVGIPIRAKNTSGYYHVGFKRKVYVVHRLIWLMTYDEWPDGEIDHINCNKLDNRLENLRLATKGQNQSNRGKSKGLTSKYKGVCWKKSNKCWTSQISHEGKCHWLGHFENELDAHKAYCEAALRLKGEFAHYG